MADEKQAGSVASSEVSKSARVCVSARVGVRVGASARACTHVRAHASVCTRIPVCLCVSQSLAVYMYVPCASMYLSVCFYVM